MLLHTVTESQKTYIHRIMLVKLVTEIFED